MNNEQLLLSEAACRLGVKPYRIIYAITNNLIPDVRRVGNRRIFHAEDLKRLAEYFGDGSTRRISPELATSLVDAAFSKDVANESN